MNRHIDIIETADGSRTLYDRDRHISYRAKAGAVTESRFVFVEGSGLVARPGPWRVLELGFGAAVNFTQTVRALLEAGVERLDYHAVEYAPVAAELLAFHDGEAGELARRALGLAADGGQAVQVVGFDGRVCLHLYPMAWLDVARELDAGGDTLRVDAVYFDPFGPRSEPESWTTACFALARAHMTPDALLATYSAATRVKRRLLEAGLHVGRANGPGRKREITFAAREPGVLEARADVELIDPAHYLEGDDA